MTAVRMLVLLAWTAAFSVAGAAGASAQQAVKQNNEAALVAAARQQPDTTRASLARAFTLSANAITDAARAQHLAHARELGRSYALAWTDPFLVRQVARFESWSPRQRTLKVSIDSLRRAGNAAFGADGAPTAMRFWRESLRRATSLGDSAGRAAALGSIGAGFYVLGSLDSASVYLTRSHRLALLITDYRTTGNAVGNLANVSKDRGDLATAAELYRQASAIRARSGDSRGIAADQNNLGLIAQTMGDLEEARRAFTQALSLNRREGRPQLVARNLTNLANLSSMASDYVRAEGFYREALAINERSGDRAESGFVLHSMGRLAMRRGDYHGAAVTLARSLQIHEEAGAVVEATAVLRDLASVQSASGNLSQALTTLRQAERAAALVPHAPALLAGVLVARADLAVKLGALAEADAAYLRAEQLYREGGDGAGRAEAQQGRAWLLHLRDDHKGALRLLDLAARAQELAGNQRAAALSQLLIGEVQRAQGDTAAARQTLGRSLRYLQDAGDAVGEAAALGALGQLALDRGAPLAAESLYRRALERLSNRPAADVRWQMHAGLARALRSRNAIGPAVQQLTAAITEIERVSGTLHSNERRGGFLADKWEVYAELALAEQSRGNAPAAFAVSERMRSWQMVGVLARGRVGARHSATAQEQDLRRRITELTRAIEEVAPTGERQREVDLSTRALASTREALDASYKAYAALLLDLNENDPAYTRLVRGETVSWRTVADLLRPDEVFLEYLLTEATSTVFVITSDTVVAIDLGINRRELTNLVEFQRQMLTRPDRLSPAALWRAPSRRLYQQLVAPVERAGLLKGKRSLVIAPHGELHFVSFSALLDRQAPSRFLAQRFQLSYAPSATAWNHPAQSRGGKTNGILALAPRMATLPATREEVESIRAIYGRRATVLVGAAATERAMRAAAPNSSIIHLATLGVLNKHNPLFSFVQLAAEGGDDGRLEVHEVFGLDLAGKLIVLSACQTALGSGRLADVPAGEDWVGLVQAFLQAGASNVLATLWPVDDRTTGLFMEHFYRRLKAGDSAAAALAAAQRNALRDERTMHPFYWAGFVLNGSR